MSTTRNFRTRIRTSRMSRMTRTSRTSRVRLIGAAATVTLAALSLTACGDGTGTKTDDAAKHVSTAPTAVTTTAPSAGTDTSGTEAPAPAPSSSPARTKPVADKGSGTGKGSNTDGNAPAPSGKSVTCDGSNTKTVAAPVQRPLNHLLLTVTNTGSRTCDLYAYPALRFGDAQAVPPVIEDSHPQAVVTLFPGETGYASVVLAAGDGSASHGRTEKSLTVYFYNRSGTESAPTPAQPPLPAKGIHIDDSLTTTYWQQSLTDALTW